jgi:hypothetical protein
MFLILATFEGVLSLMKYSLHILTVVVCCLAPRLSLAQFSDSLMNAYAESRPRERIHVHLDKQAYNREETIWYKVYILDDVVPTRLSRNLYVEWFDPEGKLVFRSTAPLYAGSSRGNLELPADYDGHFIRMRVYTRWSLNDDPAEYHERDIVIHQPKPPALPVPIPKTIQVDLFPEGGDLVAGLMSKVAYKAVDGRGMPVRIQGKITNGKGQPIDSLRSRHDGMGFFFLIPDATERYFVKWKTSEGDTGTVEVSRPRPTGATLSLFTTNENAVVKVERSEDFPEANRKFTLYVHKEGQLLFKAGLDMTGRKSLRANIPIAELSTGVLQFTLFDAEWVPIAERVVFVNNRLHEFGAKIIPQLINVSKRAKNVFDVYVSDTTMTNMSISVTDAAVAGSLLGPTIYSDLLLSPEIKGKIHNPGYYLSSDSDSVTANLDLVMLTHGWRRYDWARLKAEQAPVMKFGQEMEYMKIAGQSYGQKFVITNDLLLNLIIQYKDSSKNFLFEPLSKQGSFENRTIMYFDTARVYYGFNNNPKLNGQLQLQFDNGLLPPSSKSLEYPERTLAALLGDTSMRARMDRFLILQEDWKRRSAYKTLQEVIVKSKPKPKEDELDKKYASGLFSGGDAFVFDMTNDPFARAGMDIFAFLQGRVPGLQINMNGPQPSLSWRGSPTTVFLDQMQTDPAMLQSININDIAMVKVFRPPFFGATGGGSGGAIAIYTARGNDRKPDPNSSGKGLPSVLLAGYTRFKEFYHPRYEQPGEGPETDIRTTLYWNPYVITGKTSPRFRIEFYNNDISQRLHVVLEGVNAEGRMTRVETTLEPSVKK